MKLVKLKPMFGLLKYLMNECSWCIRIDALTRIADVVLPLYQLYYSSCFVFVIVDMYPPNWTHLSWLELF